MQKYETTVNNGTTGELTLVEEEQLEHFDVTSILGYGYGFSKSGFFDDYSYTDLVPTNEKLNITFREWAGKLLGNISVTVEVPGKHFFKIGARVTLKDLLSALNMSFDDFLYINKLKSLYYSKVYCLYNLDDLAFSNYKVVQYENDRFDIEVDDTYYNIYRKTIKWKNIDNHIHSNVYLMSYHDFNDVRNMLPEGIDDTYLDNPFFDKNENSSSGGYIYTDIRDILTDIRDKITDFSKEDNSVISPYPDTFINNFITNEGDTTDNSTIDNSVVNNNYNTIENTAGNDLLKKIYWEVYLIRTRFDNFEAKVSNTTNNFDYSTKNYIRRAFIPNKSDIKEVTTKLEDKASECLGILYQPWEFVIYTLTVFSNVTDYDNIVLETPALSVSAQGHEYSLLSSKVVNFTEILGQNQTMYNMYELYLDAVDFVVLLAVCNLAYRMGKETFNKR